jgi:hypothetical protein
MKRMLNGFKRDGITCPAQTGCQPDRLSKLIRYLVDGRL